MSTNSQGSEPSSSNTTDRIPGNNSIWLGPARPLFKVLMVVGFAAFGLSAVYLIFGKMFLGTGIGIKQYLSPLEYPVVFFNLISGALGIFIAGIYFSDKKGMIEVEPQGFFDIFSLVLSRISMIAIAGVVFVMFYEVVSRYVFTSPTLWANELSLWIAGFVFLLAGLYAMQQRSHIRIYIIYDLMPGWARKLADVVSVALLWFFTISLYWGGWNEASSRFMRMETFGTAWDPPIPGTIKMGVLIIITCVAIQALSNLIADWGKAPESHTPMDEIDQAEIEKIRRAVEG